MSAIRKIFGPSAFFAKQVLEQQRRNEEVGPLTELIRDFLHPEEFYLALKKTGIEFFCGVPDSLLKDFCAYVANVVPPTHHVITANEGTAVALAAGYHLATGNYAMVYLQNSGLGNIVNPVLSLTAPQVYSIPMLLLIGWRGEPGKRDEPQHKVQGKVTPGLLASMGVPFQILPDFEEGAEQVLATAKQHMETSKGPYCLLVKRQTFLPCRLNDIPEPLFPLNRDEAMRCVVDTIKHKDVIVSTTGLLSRELFEYRVQCDHGHERDFLTVGSMGHASSIAMGIAKFKPKRQVFCLDGDGAAIMHLGSMATIGNHAPVNFKHVIINNGVHDSVGTQPTDASMHENFSFANIAMSCGYKKAWCVTKAADIRDTVAAMRAIDGPVLLEIKVNHGGKKDVGRPTRTPQENKKDFMHFLQIG